MATMDLDATEEQLIQAWRRSGMSLGRLLVYAANEHALGADGDGHLGSTRTTPTWCPRLPDARAELGRKLVAEAERIEEEARDIVRTQRLDAARTKAAERPALLAAFDADLSNAHLLGQRCHADRDGESKKTGRHCPLDRGEDEE